MLKSGILALDLSTETGWCYGQSADAAPEWGVWQLPKQISRGMVGLAFENELDAMLEERKPRLIAYEAPLPPNLQSDAEGAFITIGLAFATEACAARWEIPVISRSSTTYRSAVIGRSRLTDEEKAIRPKLSIKTLIVNPWLQSMKWKITNHNAADAAVVFAYEAGVRHAGFGRRKVGPATT